MKNVKVQITKMVESSGNIQFFSRMIRTDAKGLAGTLEYSCHQTKHHSKEECLSRAWFDASFLVRWVGCQMSDVDLRGFDEDEESFIKTCLSIH
jgi:hypothetical protein